MNDNLDGVLTEASGAIAYGIGTGINVFYYDATGAYRAYPGANLQRFIPDALNDAILHAEMSLITPPNVPAPLSPTSRFYAQRGIPNANFGNAAVVDAANSVVGQYGRNVSNLQMELTSVRGARQNIFRFADGTTARIVLPYTTFNWQTGNTLHSDEVKAVADLGKKEAGNTAQVGQYVGSRRHQRRARADDDALRLSGTGVLMGMPQMERRTYR